MIAATLLFGLDLPHGEHVGDAAWAAFLRNEITPRFPDGLTVIEGKGQWRDPVTQQIGRESSRMVLAAVAPAPDLGTRLRAVATAYEAAFHQQSVGILLQDACGAF